MTTLQEAMRNNFEAVFIAAIRNSKPGTLKDIARLCYEAALAQQGKPCDMGQMCLNCQPRGPNGECPDQSANQAPASSASSKMIAQQPPVAWMNLKAKVPMFRSKKPSEDEGTIVEHWQPLYTAAPAPQPAQEQVGINGLTEAETSATMSVLGLSKPAQGNAELIARSTKVAAELDDFNSSLDRKAAKCIRELLTALQSAQPVSANIQTKIVKDISAHEGGKQQLPPLPTTELAARASGL